MSRVLLSLLLTFSFHSLISQRHLRTFRGVCTFPAFFFFFSMLVSLCPSFISLSPCLAPPKRRSEYMHVLKAVLLFSFLSSIFSSLFFLFFFCCCFCFCVALSKERREHTHAQKFHSFPFLCHLYLVTLNHLPNPTTDPKNFPIPQNKVQQTDDNENCHAEQRSIPTLGARQL